MLVTRLITANTRRFSVLCRKPISKEMLVKVKPVAPFRKMSSGLDMKPQNAILWFIGMSVPLAVAAYGAAQQILGRFEKADAGEYGPIVKPIGNDEWLELKEKVRAMADADDEDEDDEDNASEDLEVSETSTTVAEAIEEEEFVMVAEQQLAEPPKDE